MESATNSPAATGEASGTTAPAPELVRLRLDVAYDGTDFHGWARQKPTEEGVVRTVAQTLEDAIQLVARQHCALTVAGRTDAGVHASGQVAHVDVPRSLLETRSVAGQPQQLVRRLARLLPDDLTVRKCTFAAEGFDARFSALRRHYVYRVTTAPSGPLPTRARDTALWTNDVELAAMQASADALLGLHDFAAFCKYKPHATTVRELQNFTWHDISTETEPQLYEARVTADAFCWSMVRSLVGACLTVGQGRRDLDFIPMLLQQSSRSSHVPVAEARGLSLVGVDYPEDSQLAARAEQTRALRR